MSYSDETPPPSTHGADDEEPLDVHVRSACAKLWTAQEPQHVVTGLRGLQEALLHDHVSSYDPSDVFLAIQAASLKFHQKGDPPPQQQQTKQEQQEDGQHDPQNDNNSSGAAATTSDDNSSSSIRWSILQESLWTVASLARVCVGPGWWFQALHRRRFRASRSHQHHYNQNYNHPSSDYYYPHTTTTTINSNGNDDRQTTPTTQPDDSSSIMEKSSASSVDGSVDGESHSPTTRTSTTIHMATVATTTNDSHSRTHVLQQGEGHMQQQQQQQRNNNDIHYFLATANTNTHHSLRLLEGVSHNNTPVMGIWYPPIPEVLPASILRFTAKTVERAMELETTTTTTTNTNTAANSDNATMELPKR